MRNYRNAFLTALSVNLALVVAAGLLWWRSQSTAGLNWRPTAAASKAEDTQSYPPASESETLKTVSDQPASSESPLSPIQLSPERLQNIGIKTGVVEMKDARDEIRVTGDVEVAEERLAYVQVRFPGWIRKVYANANYRYVHQGEPLFTIYSPDLVIAQQEYLLARQNRNELSRSSVPGVTAGSASILSAATERLKQWEVPAREISELEATGKIRHEIEIDSPVSGYITERNALPNQYVQPETRLYTVADLSTIWVYAAVFQTDLGRINVGNPATVTVNAYPGRTFAGRVQQILPQLDMNTRSARVRLVFTNAGLKLMPGMFVNVSLTVPLGRQPVIPASAVLHSGTRQIAFVDRGGGYLEPREIKAGTRAGDDVIVLQGLKAGERIVTSANFLIDSESQLQAAIGAFAPPPPGAGAAAGMNAPSAQAKVEFTTAPSPPHKGDNTFRVKLTESNGSPVTGAQVTVTFFMPAMPSMGMAAMRVPATLTDKGGGNYEGSGQLQSGGTWQVTIVAEKNGQTLARKQLSVNAEGGM